MPIFNMFKIPMYVFPFNWISCGMKKRQISHGKKQQNTAIQLIFFFSDVFLCYSNKKVINLGNTNNYNN